MTLDDIFKRQDISVRAYRLSKHNGFNTIQDLKFYYNQHEHFLNWKGCGLKTNDELIALAQGYLPDETVARQPAEKTTDFYESRSYELQKKKRLQTTIANLTSLQRQVINYFILIKIKELPVRSSNGVKRHLSNDLEIDNFAERAFFSPIMVKQWELVGKNSVPKIELFINVVEDFVTETSLCRDNKHLELLKNDYLIQLTYSHPAPKEVLESQSIFLLTNFLLNNNLIFNKRTTKIVQRVLKINNQKPSSLPQVSKDEGVSRERIRQIRERALSTLFEELLFIQNFNDDLLEKYGIDTTSDQIEVSSALAKKINTHDGTNFSKAFITCILSVYLQKSFSIIGSLPENLWEKRRSRLEKHHSSPLFLVKKSHSNLFDFNALIDDINRRIGVSIKESYAFNFKSYLLRFLNDQSIENLVFLIPLCKTIIKRDFKKVVGVTDDLIIFQKNIKKSTREYILEALENLKKPSSLEAVFNKIMELYPNYNLDIQKTRTAILRYKDFSSIGRKGIFVLKLWEDEIQPFQSDQIKTATLEFLANFDTPQHEKDVVEYLKGMFPKISTSAIYSNLYINQSKVFIFFEGQRIGLKKEKYPRSFKAAKKRRMPRSLWEDNYNKFREITEKEDRFPSSRTGDKTETKLERWFYVQRSLSLRGLLDPKRIALIKTLEIEFPELYNKQIGKVKHNYELLKEFIQKHHRAPVASKDEENALYHFLYRQQKYFDKGELKGIIKTKFLEISKLLETDSSAS